MTKRHLFDVYVAERYAATDHSGHHIRWRFLGRTLAETAAVAMNRVRQTLLGAAVDVELKAVPHAR